MTKFSMLTTAAILALAATPSFAATQACAIISGGTAGGGLGVSSVYHTNATSGAANEGCNALITFNANGSITTTFPNAAISYDNGGDDILVGVVNLTGHAITSFSLTGTNAAEPPFEFDGDGACDPTWTFSSGGCGTATSGYAPQGVSFSAISGSFLTGTVNFGGAGIAASTGTAWFSLEGPVDKNLSVNAPEPSSILLFGTVLALAGGALRRRMRS
jgi:hypothetical protein